MFTLSGEGRRRGQDSAGFCDKGDDENRRPSSLSFRPATLVNIGTLNAYHVELPLCKHSVEELTCKQDCRNEEGRIVFISGSRHIQIAMWAHAVPVMCHPMSEI